MNVIPRIHQSEQLRLLRELMSDAPIIVQEMVMMSTLVAIHL